MASTISGASHNIIDKPTSYFQKIDDQKKSSSKKVESDFQKILKTDQNKRASKIEQKTKVNDGIDFALKEISEDYERQILGIMWNMVFAASEKEFEGGLGEEVFSKELVNEMIKSANIGEMGDIAKQIYNGLKEKEGKE